MNWSEQRADRAVWKWNGVNLECAGRAQRRRRFGL